MNFTSLSDKLFDYIVRTIEKYDPDGKIDIDFRGDILHLETGFGLFILNKQSVAKEIWMVSPVSGPYHFGYSDGMWKSKSGIDILNTLSTELAIPFLYES